MYVASTVHPTSGAHERRALNTFSLATLLAATLLTLAPAARAQDQGWSQDRPMIWRGLDTWAEGNPQTCCGLPVRVFQFSTWLPSTVTTVSPFGVRRTRRLLAVRPPSSTFAVGGRAVRSQTRTPLPFSTVASIWPVAE